MWNIERNDQQVSNINLLKPMSFFLDFLVPLINYLHLAISDNPIIFPFKCEDYIVNLTQNQLIVNPSFFLVFFFVCFYKLRKKSIISCQRLKKILK